MKNIQKTLLVSLVPLLAPLSAVAETGRQSESIQPVKVVKGAEGSWRASQVIGLDVKNSEGATIGEVEDLVLDMKSGEVVAVIITSGGFLGIADTLSAVPVAVLRYDDRSKALKTKLTKEQLGKAPQFKSDAWPDYSDATSIEALRSYRDSIDGDMDDPDNTSRVENNTSRDKDNSAENERGMKKDFVSPTDQGNSDKDIQMTRDIRSGIMDTDLSFNAKNIKIITRNERVTLNGVVESDAEHQAILRIALKHCDQARLTDNLKVKTN